MYRFYLLFAILAAACGPQVDCKIVHTVCAQELEMWSCIDQELQTWYEFSDGTQIACTPTDCTTAADEAASYCQGLNKP